MDGAKMISLSNLQGYIKYSQVFKDICVLWGKEQKKHVSKCLRRKN